MRKTPIIAVVVIASVLWGCRKEPQAGGDQTRAEAKAPVRKLYWFVPDGMRADPDVFNIYRWASEGRLPNLKKMIERGSYGYCKPNFPSHTPVNFATLFTGAYPEVHGVNDGPMRTEGNPLSQVSLSGFTSAAKQVEPIWVTLEKALRCDITLLSVPGSTPPELKHGITIHGRWGRWGADFHAVNFQDQADPLPVSRAGARLFFTGPPLTQQVSKKKAEGWQSLPSSFSEPLEAALPAWGTTIHACAFDSTDNGTKDYDRISFSLDKQKILCSLKAGQWSDWVPITLKWQVPVQKLERDIETSCKFKVIRLQTNGVFRIRVLYNGLNRFLVEPGDMASEILQGVGPMVDFVDNFPAQLIHYPEDKATFVEEADLSLDWHRDAATFLLKHHAPRIYIQNIYTPNQMLTSRWWLGYIDPQSTRYNDVPNEEREKLWQEVHGLYRKLDDILGRLLDQADAETFVVLSSDHGAIPINTYVRLNNLFAREGLLKFTNDPTGDRVIDWRASKAVYLNMAHVYLNPNGLDGDWKRPTGAEYEQLRKRVKQLLLDLQDERGIKPVEKIVEWENAQGELHLQPGRAGDLLLANRAGYGWTEETTEDQKLFSVPLISGYKQAILAEHVKGLWTPFVIVGPGIKAGQFLGETPIEMVDQYPTLCEALGIEVPKWVQGKSVRSAFAAPPSRK